MRAQVYCQPRDVEVLRLLTQSAAGLRLVGESDEPTALLDPGARPAESAIIVLHVDRDTGLVLRSLIDDRDRFRAFLSKVRNHYLILVLKQDICSALGREIELLSGQVDLQVVAYPPGAPADRLADLIVALQVARTTLLADPGRYVRTGLEASKTFAGYEINSQSKTVTIYTNGHGIIEFTTEIQVKGDDFEGPIHYFGLNDFVPKDIKLPSLSELTKTPPTERGLAPMFNYRLLLPVSRRATSSIVAQEISTESTDRMRVVQFKLFPKPSPEEVVKYAWEWSFPGLFVTKGEDTSGFRCIRDFWNFSIEIRFVHPAPNAHTAFAQGGEPTLHVLGLGDELAVLPALGVDEVNYRSYKWSLTKGVAGNQYIVHWVLSDPLRVGDSACPPF